MLRSLVIGRLGRAGEESVIAEARKRFASHCDGSALLPADLRNAVCVIAYLNYRKLLLIIFISIIFLQ